MSEKPTTPAGYVTSKSSFERPDRGWDTIEFTLPIGAGDAEIQRAIETWQRMRAASHAACQAQQPASSTSAQQAPPPRYTDYPATEAQRRKIDDLARDLGWSGEQLAEHARSVVLADLTTLTKRQASTLIDNLIGARARREERNTQRHRDQDSERNTQRGAPPHTDADAPPSWDENAHMDDSDLPF